MANQATIVSFRDSKTPEERRKYVDEQIALGNKNYKPRPEWIKENQDKFYKYQTQEVLNKSQ